MKKVKTDNLINKVTGKKNDITGIIIIVVMCIFGVIIFLVIYFIFCNYFHDNMFYLIQIYLTNDKNLNQIKHVIMKIITKYEINY